MFLACEAEGESTFKERYSSDDSFGKEVVTILGGTVNVELDLYHLQKPSARAISADCLALRQVIYPGDTC